MNTHLWYCYEKATGQFAGSGTPYINNATHGSTAKPITQVQSDSDVKFVWNAQLSDWQQEPAPEQGEEPS